MGIIRANGSTPFRRPQKQNLPFPFSKKLGGEKKKMKKQKEIFCFGSSLRCSKTLIF
jgi:hypothetical protein